MHLIFILHARVLDMVCMCISGMEGKFTLDLTLHHAYFELQLELIPSHRSSKMSLWA